MRWLLKLRHRKQANVVRLAHFFERPAHAHVASQPLPFSRPLGLALGGYCTSVRGEPVVGRG